METQSVPEVLEDGLTGFIVETIDDAVRAVGRLDEIDRARCRRVFEERFDAGRMAREYLEIYALPVSPALRAGRSRRMPGMPLNAP